MTIAEVCRLSEEVRSGNLLEAVFLDNVKHSGTQESDCDFVLSATYPTVPVRDLIETIGNKLALKSPQGGFVLSGTLGSGKSHALLTLYHVAKEGPAVHEWLNKANIKTEFPPGVRVAVVQMVAERPPNFWQPLYICAGEERLLSAITPYPSREDWLRIADNGHILLIIDELELWYGQLDSDADKKRTLAALQNLLEAAKVPNVPLAAAVSVYGRDADIVGFLDRTKPPTRDMTTAQDREEILRHRLVPEINMREVERIVDAYISLYEKIRNDLPSRGQALADMRRRMLQRYPFHPDFVARAFQSYATASHSETVRGIIFLFARLLQKWADAKDLICAGDIDLLDDDIASDLRKLDFDLVNHAVEDLQQRCEGFDYSNETIATSLLYSFAPEGYAGATTEEIILNMMRPNVNVDDLLYSVERTADEAWFMDKIDERLVITREIVLRKQIEQQARALKETPDGRKECQNRIKQVIRETMKGTALYLLDEDTLPEGGTNIKYLVSLEHLPTDKARQIYQGKGNLIVLIAPKAAVQGNIAQDEDAILKAARVLVCERMLKQRSKRQSDLKRHQNDFISQLREKIENAFAVWYRISRTNDLGEEPQYVIRPVESALSQKDIEQAIFERNDVDTIKGGMRRVLLQAGQVVAKGSAQAGRTIGEIKKAFREILGLPILMEDRQLYDALASMVTDDTPDTGAVVSAGRTLYPYQRVDLPYPLDEQWRIWLKKFAPAPPAKGDVKRAVEHILADAKKNGKRLSTLCADVAQRATQDVPKTEVLRALVELIADGQAVVEQEDDRYPDDGLVSSEALIDAASAWLSAFAPPDARSARRRIRELVEKAGPEGISVGEIKRLLALENIPENATARGLEILLMRENVVAYDGIQAISFFREMPPLPDSTIIKLPSTIIPLTPPQRKHDDFDISPYRLLSEFLRELRNRLHDSADVKSIRFEVSPADEQEDNFFGVKNAPDEISEVTLRHLLTYRFKHPLNKPALLQLSEKLVERLNQHEDVILTAHVESEVPV